MEYVILLGLTLLCNAWLGNRAEIESSWRQWWVRLAHRSGRK